jgi:hypothetical protein
MKTKEDIHAETSAVVKKIVSMCVKKDMTFKIHCDINYTKPVDTKPYPKAKWKTFFIYDPIINKNVELGYWM